MKPLQRIVCLWLWVLLFPIQIGFSQDLNDLKAGVVKITAKPPDGSRKVGTGFIIRLETEVVYIVTAAHVVAGDAQPQVEFFSKRNLPVPGSVLPGAETEDDVRGLALIVVRGKDSIPDGIQSLPFSSQNEMVFGGETLTLIGHPGGSGAWTVLKRTVANRVGRDITFDPDVPSRFSGGPMIMNGHVIGVVMSKKESFGLGILFKSVQTYVEGFGVTPQGSQVVQAAQPSTKKDEGELPTTITGKDGAPMVLIPAGEFWMGSPDSEGSDDEHPQHKVYLDSFYMDQYEVTTARYAKFKKAKGRSAPKDWDRVDLSRDREKPVIGISWHDAKTYCEWAGKRLPTEAEWEKAARGTEERMYPWGNEPPSSNLANFDQDWTPAKLYTDRRKPVGSYECGKTPEGVYDLAGNVWEWVADWYEKTYYQNSPDKNPKGPSSGKHKVLRGGSLISYPRKLRSASRFRNTPTLRDVYNGVRCAKDAR